MVFDKQKYRVWKLPYPLLLHWVINPGLAFNELVLGQRIPRVTLIDRTGDATLDAASVIRMIRETAGVGITAG